MVSFLRRAVIKHHKLGLSKTTEMDSVPVLEAYTSEIKMLADSYSHQGCGEASFLPLLVSGVPDFCWPAAAEPHLCSVFTLLSSLCLRVAPLLLRRTPAIEFRIHP